MTDTPRRFRWGIPIGIAALLMVTGLVGLRLLPSGGGRGPDPVVLAFAGSLTGSHAPIGTEALAMTRIYLDDLNAAGGIDGRPVELKVYDDRSDPAVARANAAEIVSGPAVAVLGHSGNDMALAAGPVYRDGHIPAVTGHADADTLTAGNPWYFRTLPAVSSAAAFQARYLREVVLRRGGQFKEPPSIVLAVTPGAFGAAFAAGFARGGEGLPTRTMVLPDGEPEAAARDLAARLAGTRDPEGGEDAPPPSRVIVIGADFQALPGIVRAVRRAGVRALLMLPSGAASEGFARTFHEEPEERRMPGFFLDNTLTLAPEMIDATGLYGQSLATRYEARTGKRPGWFMAGAQDAVRLLVTAMRDAGTAGGGQPTPAAREKLRAALAAIDGPATAVTGVGGKLFFDRDRSMPGPSRAGVFQSGHLVSAPLQLAPVRDPGLVDATREIALGHMIRDQGQLFWLQRVVATGIDLVRIGGIDVKSGTFNADLYFWVRYADTDDLPAQIEFPGFLGRFDAVKPLRARDEAGTAWRLWRVTGDFRADFDLHDYPFDTQALTIRMRNADHPREEILYVIDTFGLKLRGSGEIWNAEAFRDLQQWRALAARPFAETFTVPSTLGDPALFETDSRMDYGGLAVGVVVQRKALAFMVKAMLPLFLLSLVVAATLFFPQSLSKERTTIPVTAILTTAVLLISLTNQLPPIGYTVALEYIFYAFFMLCLTAMLIGLLVEILRDKTFHHHVIKVDLMGRVLFLVIVGATVGGFVWRYGATL